MMRRVNEVAMPSRSAASKPEDRDDQPPEDPDEREQRNRNDNTAVFHDRFPRRRAAQWVVLLPEISVNAPAHSAQYVTDSRETPHAEQQACPHWMQPSSSNAYTKGLPQRHRCSMTCPS